MTRRRNTIFYKNSVNTPSPTTSKKRRCIREAISSPSILTFTLRYERILNRMYRTLTPHQWQIACELLGWMVCAKRPLRWHEIQAARSINTTDQTFDFTSRKLRSDIRTYCGSLIQELPGQRVQLVHTTAKM